MWKVCFYLSGESWADSGAEPKAFGSRHSNGNRNYIQSTISLLPIFEGMFAAYGTQLSPAVAKEI